MGQMLVRNLDDVVIERLKRRAAERGTSLEQVAREALAAAAGEDRAGWIAEAEALRAQCPPLPADSVATIRAWRDRDRLSRLEERLADERDGVPR
jgi:plasmid stability protein